MLSQVGLVPDPLLHAHGATAELAAHLRIPARYRTLQNQSTPVRIPARYRTLQNQSTPEQWFSHTLFYLVLLKMLSKHWVQPGQYTFLYPQKEMQILKQSVILVIKS